MAPGKLRLKMAPRRRGLGGPLGCPPRRRGRDHRGPRRPPGCQHRRFGPGGRRRLGPFRTAFRKLKTIPGVALGVPRSSGPRPATICPASRARPLGPWACQQKRRRATAAPEGPARGPEAVNAPGRVGLRAPGMTTGAELPAPRSCYPAERASTAIAQLSKRLAFRWASSWWERGISESGLVTSRRRHCSV
jgi:hypothetical protein